MIIMYMQDHGKRKQEEVPSPQERGIPQEKRGKSKWPASAIPPNTRHSRVNTKQKPRPPTERVIKNPEASFLGICGELRNEVYRLILISPCPIYVIPEDHIEPELLRTCSQIRKEARSIFEKENDFRIEVFDMRLLYPQLGHWVYRANYKLSFSSEAREYTFRNLRQWAHAAFQDSRVPNLRYSRREEFHVDRPFMLGRVAVVQDMFKVLEKCQEVFKRLEIEQSWERVLDVLLDWKDQVWLKEKVLLHGIPDWYDRARWCGWGKGEREKRVKDRLRKARLPERMLL
jgi:hypothetical protein